MRTPLRIKSAPRSRVAQSKSMPAPVGGLNARDPMADMKAYHAIVLDNWFPRTNYLEIRGGYLDHASGTTGNIKTLATYNKMTGESEMFAFTDYGVYDVSFDGTVGASKLERTNGKHQYVNFGDGTSSWLIAVNGVDKPAYYDGTTWIAVDGSTSPALTGLPTTSIASVFVFKGRLIFIEANSLSFWYLASGVAGGALAEFNLAGVAKKGGYLVAGASWTMDGGSGPDDRAVFVTSEGEVIIYSGTNPSDSSSWALSGVFDLGKPLGRRCFVKFAGDLICLTQNGAYQLSQALQSAIVDKRLAITDIIEQKFNEASLYYGNNWGWEAIIYPAQSAMLVNVPIEEEGKHYQFVMNTITKAWCKFTDWNAETFTVFNEQLYFATGTSVKKAWYGTDDGGNNIVAYGKTAFSYFNDLGSQKRFNMFRPVLMANGSMSFLTDIDVDFNDTDITGIATYINKLESRWDVDNWDEAYWSGSMKVVNEWTSPTDSVGYCASGKVKIATKDVLVQWMANDWIFERGGPL